MAVFKILFEKLSDNFSVWTDNLNFFYSENGQDNSRNPKSSVTVLKLYLANHVTIFLVLILSLTSPDKSRYYFNKGANGHITFLVLKMEFII